MSLSEFLATLANGAIQVSVLDNDGSQLIKLEAAGYLQVVEATLSRIVAEVTINSPQLITVKLDAAS